LQLPDISDLGCEQETDEMPMHYIAEDLRQPLLEELCGDVVRGAERLLANWVAFEDFVRSEVIRFPQPPRRPDPIDVPDAA
jgi:hypothetical protein